MTKTARPLCRMCRKPLKANTDTATFTQDGGPPSVREAAELAGVPLARIHRVEWGHEEETETMPDPYSGVPKRYVMAGRRTGKKYVRRLTWRTGSYGYRGNGLFCTLTCGCRWAVRFLHRYPGATL